LRGTGGDKTLEGRRLNRVFYTGGVVTDAVGELLRLARRTILSAERGPPEAFTGCELDIGGGNSSAAGELLAFSTSHLVIGIAKWRHVKTRSLKNQYSSIQISSRSRVFRKGNAATMFGARPQT